jgi:hypothetical protein
MPKQQNLLVPERNTTMAYTSVMPGYAASSEAAPLATPRRGLLSRFLDAVVETRMRQAEREIALYLGGQGGKFTDEAERQIERRFLANSRGL